MRKFVLLALVGLGCAHEPAADSDIAAINAIQRRADEAVTSGNVDGYLAVATDDAVLMPPGSEALLGKKAIREWSRKLRTRSRSSRTTLWITS